MKRDKNESTETYSEEGAECPYCGHLNKDWDVLCDGFQNEHKCNMCEREFDMDAECTWSWRCKQKGETK